MTDLADLAPLLYGSAVPDRRGNPGGSWRDLAACRGLYGVFHPAGYNDSANRRQVERAKAVCVSCPVVEPCLAEADSEGIWGGTTPRERGHSWGGRSVKARTARKPPVPAPAPPAPVPVVVPWQRDGIALRQALAVVARHDRVALRSRTDPAAGVISRRAGRALRDHGLIARDRTVALTGPCWALTPTGRTLATALQQETTT